MEPAAEQASILGTFLLENLEIKGCAALLYLFMHKLAITESPISLLHAGYDGETAECFMYLSSSDR